jgi:hypothetical protein
MAARRSFYFESSRDEGRQGYSSAVPFLADAENRRCVFLFIILFSKLSSSLDPDALQYVQSMEIDSRGWMWILDVGRRNILDDDNVVVRQFLLLSADTSI